MLYLGRPQRNRWVLTVFAPPREVFAVAEQVMALPPFNFRVVDDHSAEVVQDIANGLFGQWSRVKRPKNKIRIDCETTPAGTRLTVAAEGQRSSTMRALNLIRILSKGERDTATVYRFRRIPPGLCTVVQSWAGTGYPIYLSPDHGAPRGVAVRPGTPLVAVEQVGRWVHVRAGVPEQAQLGWIEADQLVPDDAPIRSTALSHQTL